MARADGHRWRKRASALLTGIGTVLEDDPQLDVRLVDTPRQPRVVLVDSRRIEDSFPALDYFETKAVPFVVAVNRLIPSS